MSGSRISDGTNGSSRSGGPPPAQPYRAPRFVYELVDLAGRPLGVLEPQAPLRADDTVQLESSDSWRVVAVLGRTATLVRT